MAVLLAFTFLPVSALAANITGFEAVPLDAGIGESPQGDGAETPAVPLPLSSAAVTVTTAVYGGDITGFEPISVNAGITGAAIYPNAAVVITYLENQYNSVTAAVYGGGEVSVPVTGWADTDTYNPVIAGSYTFTATLGTIPAGCTLGDGMTATAEVVIAANPADEPVIFSDTNLKYAICAALKKTSDYILTVGDMASLTELDASNWGITNLTGLWTAVNLETLNLSGNPLTANVTNSTVYNNVFIGLEALTKLKELYLSNSGLGVNKAENFYYNPCPSTLTAALPKLTSLETLDLSYNEMPHAFSLYTSMPQLKSIDLRGNYLNGFNIEAKYLPKIETIDISENHIYFVDGDDTFTIAYGIGVDKFVREDMRSLSTLVGLNVLPPNQTSFYNADAYYFGGGTAIDIGQVLGDTLTFNIVGYAKPATTKATINGEKYTVVSISESMSGGVIVLSGLTEGEHTVTLSAMHMGGDIQEYTVKFNVSSHNWEGEDSAGIVDTDLQYAVCQKLGIPASEYSTHVVTQAEMASLTGSLTVNNINSAEGIQYAAGLTGLTINGAFNRLPDLSALTKLTTVDFRSTAAGTVTFPDLAAQTALTSLTLSSKEAEAVNYPELKNQTVLTTLWIMHEGSEAVLPDISSLKSLQTLNLYNDGIRNLPTGTDKLSSLGSISLYSVNPGFTFPDSIKDLPLTTLNLSSCGLAEVPAIVGQIESLESLYLNKNSYTSLPDLSGLTKLKNLYLSENTFTDIPDTIGKLTALEELTISYNVTLEKATADLSELKKLKTLDIGYCGLKEFPSGFTKLKSLQTLTMGNNKLIEINADLSGLESLKTLTLTNNYLTEVPGSLKSLKSLKQLNIRWNQLGDIAEDSFEGMTAMTSLSISAYVEMAAGGSGFAPGTSIAKAIDNLKQQNPSIRVTIGSYGGSAYSELTKLESTIGAFYGYDLDGSGQNRTISAQAPEDTGSITFTGYGAHRATTITIGDKTVSSGEPITVTGLKKGQNQVKVIACNALDGQSIVYTLNIYVGSYVGGEEFPQEGRTYQVNVTAMRATADTTSMANSYIRPYVVAVYEDGRFALDFRVTAHNWIKDVYYMDSVGIYQPAELIDFNISENQASYRLYTDTLDSALTIKMFVLPMGYSPNFRLVFNTGTITDITEGGGEEPGGIRDGEYSLPVRLWHAVSDQTSMGDAALTKTARLVVEDGQGIVHLKFSPLTVEALNMTGYLANLKLATNVRFNELGGIESADLTDAAVISSYDGVWDSFNHPDTGTDANVKGKAYPKEVSIPVELESEYTYVQVYVPVMEALSTGSGTQFARVRLDWSGLAAVGEPDPDAEPAHEIGDNDGDGSIDLTENDLSGISDPTQNVRIVTGGASLNIPAQYLNRMFADNSGATLQFKANESPSNTKTAVLQILTDNDELTGAFDLNLTLGTQSISDLGGRIKITFSLTDAQVTALQSADSRKLCYYNPATGALTNMNATFDLTAKTVTFYTDHLSTYVLIGTTSAGPGGPGGPGSPGNSHGLADGTYSIVVAALQEFSNDRSMADQFILEPAELRVSGERITVAVVMYGTSSSAELSSGIKMSYITVLQYKSSSGSWVNAVSSRDNSADTLTARMTVSSLDDVYLRVLVPDYMGPDYKVFRLVFDESSLEEGGVDFGSGVTPPAGDYTITATAGEGGTISPNGEVEVKKSADQTFTITPAAGYKIKDVLVDGTSAGAVSTYTFTEVKADHTISATFEKTGVPVFTDTANHWAKDAIAFVAGKGLFKGTSDTAFSPDIPMTRSMFVTILGRMHGIDTSTYTTVSFSDVDAAQYYAPYVEWAAKNGIVKGIGDGKFAPDTTVTREQAATMLANYRAFAGLKDNSAVSTENGLGDGLYTVKSTALKENSDELSMADQFLTERATLTVSSGKVRLNMTWHGTEYITMDMIKELKYQQADGSFVEVSRTVSADKKNMSISLDIADINKATIIQVYVPEGMGESRPKFRLTLDLDTLTETAAGFADDVKISSWAKDGVLAMQKAGLFKGDNKGNFNPQDSITRAEAAMIFARSLGFAG